MAPIPLEIKMEKEDADPDPSNESEGTFERTAQQASVGQSQLQVKLTRLPASVLQQYNKDATGNTCLDGDTDLRTVLGLHTELDIKFEPGEDLKEEPLDPMDHDGAVDNNGDLLPTSEHILVTNVKHINDHEDYSRPTKKQRKEKSKKTNTKNQNNLGLQSKKIYTTRARMKNEKENETKKIIDSKKGAPAKSDVSAKTANNADGLLPPSQTISETTEKQMHDREDYSKLSKKKAKGINKKTNTKNKEGLQSQTLNTTRARKKNENRINIDSENNVVSEKENSKHADGKLDVGQKVSKESTIKCSSNNFSCKKCMFTTDIERVFKSHLNAHSAVKTYTCDKCPYITTIETNLIYHIRKRHTTPDYVCKVCDKKYTTLSALNSHLITHSGEKSSKSRSTDSDHNIAIKKLNTNNEKNNCVNLSTQICDDAALANNKLDERQDILSPDGKECSGLQEKACELTQDLRNYSDLFIAKYSCSQCKYTTNAANLLKSHIQAHSAAKKYICDICSYIAKDKQWLVSHLRTHNGKKSKPHKCEICDKKFSERYQLTVHVRTHTGEKPYNCKLCDKKFAYSYGVTLHMKTHTGEDKKYTCKLCDKKFTSTSAFNNHVRIHTGDKPFSCKLCSKKFIRNDALNSHIRLIHKGEKSYGCEICSKKFGQRCYLRDHLRTHTGEKPYSCKFCDKKFGNSSTLYTHQKLHTGEKPHACKLCDRKFIASSALTSHMRTHTGEKPYSCKICSRKFARTITLKHHMVIHTGGKPFACNICGKAYRRKTTLKAHFSTHV